MLHFNNYALIRKTALTSLSDDRVKRFIESSLSKDIAFKNTLIGLIMGQFTLTEYTSYQLDASEYNKRMVAMLKKRLKDSLGDLR